jgi:hypothetical protein
MRAEIHDVQGGLYIVTLRNDEPISVNRGDRRIEHRCIRVTRANCKFGKARDFVARRAGYVRVFGAENVTFTPLFALDDIARAERIVLADLAAWRLRGPAGRRNEWLGGIAPQDVARIALRALERSGISFAVLGHVAELPASNER